MAMSDFWKKWLNVWSFSVVLFGLFLAGAAFPSTDGLVRMLFELIAPEPFAPSASLRFAIGLMGAVTMGWGGTLFAVFQAAHCLDTANARPIWRLVAGVAIIWFIIDSAISIATGFWLNALSNTVFIALLFLPIIRTAALRG